MRDKYLAALTAMILTTGLSLPVIGAHTPQLRLTSMSKTVLVQQSLFSFNPELESAESSPADRGAPRDRKGGATHAT